MEKRLEKGFIQGWFRLRSTREWRTIRISQIPSDKEKTYLYTIQKLPDEEKGILETFVRINDEVMK